MAWLMSHHKVATSEEAVMLGNDMQRAGLLHHVSFKRPFQDKQSMYRCCMLHALPVPRLVPNAASPSFL